MTSSAHTGAGGIFVLGLQRSGTTWIANMLAGSGAVAAITAEDHRGVHESIFFSHFAQAFGPFSDAESQADFREAFLKSDYFILSGLDAGDLDGILADARDHADVFARFMERVAHDQGCSQWLEKSPHHTRLAEMLGARFPQARFVCVIRDSQTLIQSRLAAYGRTPKRGAGRWADIIRGALSNALAGRRLRAFAGANDRALLLEYSAMVSDKPAAQTALVQFLDLNVAPETLVSRFAPNTSHDRGAATRGLDLIDRTFVALGDALGSVLPLSVLSKIEDRRRGTRGHDWPDWVWRRSGWSPPSGKTGPHA